jgi:hypothetical protein
MRMKLHSALIPIVTGVLIAGIASRFVTSQGAQVQPCDATKTEISAFTSLKRQYAEDGSRRVQVERRVTSSSRSISYRFVAFADETQIGADDEPVTIPCGESRYRTYTLPNKSNSFSIVFFEDPLVPLELVNKSPDEDIPQAWLTRQVIDWSNTESVVFGKAGAFESNRYAGIPTKMVSTQRREGYLFLGADVERQVFRARATSNTFDFGVFFAQTDDANQKALYTITCLLDHQQQPAFNGQVAWSGRIPSGQGVILRGQIKATKPGWHRLRCLALGNTYADEGRESPFPHTIDSMFVYFEP